MIDSEKLNTDEFIQLPKEKRDKIYVLKGHIHFGLHNYMEGSIKYLTFLRNPINRIISHYKYVIANPNHRLHKFAKSRKFRDYVKDINPYVNNAQITHLSGVRGGEEQMLTLALNNLESYFPVVGIVENYNESLIMMFHEFGWKLPYYQKLNSTINESNFDQRDVDTIKRYYQGDIELYDIYRRKFEEKLKISSLSHRFDLFRLRYKNQLYSTAKKYFSRR